MNRLDTYLAAALVSLAVHLPLMAQEVTYELLMNPYCQLESRLYQAYGSGDTNQDGIVNWDDYDAMVWGTQNDYADVDGNGIASDTTDQRLLSEFLNAERNYLPGQWNALQTRAEREDWTKIMLAIDQTDTNTWIYLDFMCGHFASQLGVNNRYTEGETDFPEGVYDTTNIGRFNIPVYVVGLSPNKHSMGHAMNGFLAGDDPTDFYDWCFIEPQKDALDVQPGEVYFIRDCRVIIKGPRTFEYGERLSPTIRGPALIIFNIDSLGVPSVWTSTTHLPNPNPDMVLTRPDDLPRIIPKTIAWDTTPPEIDITYPEQDTTYGEFVTKLKYNLSDEYPDSSWYSIDGGLTKILAPWNSDTTIAGLNSEQGENRWIVYAKDKAGNEASDTVRFNVDTTNTAVEDHLVSSFEYRLTTYPNPFNSSTTVEYHVPGPDNVSLKIYDILGREVTALPGGMRTPGVHRVEFDASGYPAGLYFLELETAKGHREIQKLILLR